MATVQVDDYTHPHHYFSDAEERQLQNDDSDAFTHVTGILLFVVSAGLVLITVSVFIMLSA
jgi:hypothetical protein